MGKKDINSSLDFVFWIILFVAVILLGIAICLMVY